MRSTLPLLALLLLSYPGEAQQKTSSEQHYGTRPDQQDYEFREASPGGTGKFYFGREIAGIMRAGGGSWLDRSTREEEEQSSRIIALLPLKAGSTVADVGAGTGYYTFRIAEKVPGGKVYAVDIQEEFVQRLKERRDELGAGNVEVVQGGERSPHLPENSCDLIIMVDVYHELLFPREMLQAMRKALKPGGKLALIEYKAEDPGVAIRPLHKMSVAQVRKELDANGYRLSKADASLPLQHFLLFEKK